MIVRIILIIYISIGAVKGQDDNNSFHTCAGIELEVLSLLDVENLDHNSFISSLRYLEKAIQACPDCEESIEPCSSILAKVSFLLDCQETNEAQVLSLLSDVTKMLNKSRDPRLEMLHLLDVGMSYYEMHYAIHDKMMNLYTWKEFIWFFNKMEYDWQLFKDANNRGTLDEIDLGSLSHASIEHFDTCLENLRDSFRSNFRPDYEMPCNELESALWSLLTIYYPPPSEY